MIQKFYDTNKSLLIIILISGILFFTESCTTTRRGSYQKYKHYGSSAYSNRNSSHYRAKRNAQPIAKNYRIRNTRTSVRY